MTDFRFRSLLAASFVSAASIAGLGAQSGAAKPPATPPASAAPAAQPGTVPGAVTPPADYVIGPDDVLAVVFWKEKDFTTDVTVRPDGKITLPLLDDVQAAGLTTEQLRDAVKKVADAYMKEPSVTVAVKAINSRKVYITGAVQKPAAYQLTDHMTVLNLITIAGGLQEFASKDDILVLRTVPGKAQQHFKVNYDDIAKGKNVGQNIELRPGDQVIVR
jgi:polysaccharide export outer membrane protein